ncbi:hypothetical protein [Nocardioides okcheonensis]|uniref:hypothetical protein n=1 Tax=Nocardioides okcheonensis TaxID=2894081 RepID=UPI001E320D53|nr:hypothetical protein [Nocardioides okcheonensis]UFN44974.1 hypothetical protein LN652_01770 [Nocardioides okcheonensis]
MGRQVGAGGAGRLELRDVGQARTRDEGDPRGRVVGGEERLELVVGAERLGEQVHDPARV